MVWRAKSKSKVNAYGVAKIKRATYNTVDGVSQRAAWWALQKAAMKRDCGKCVLCNRRGIDRKATEVHHIKPLNDGGTNTLSNAISLCDDCHDSRHRHMFRVQRTDGPRHKGFQPKARPKPKIL